MSFALWTLDNTMLPKSQLTTLAGKSTDLATVAAGKPMVVNLWATWCPPCRLELPYLAAAQRQEPEINFVFADQGEDAVTVARYLDAAHLELANVLLDINLRLGREIGVTVLPVTLFYDAGGRMVDTHLGALSPSLLAEKLNKLRPAGKP
ncbi:MAG: TlpA family protein disulfide reductase [Burkholderiales bacterium]|nr:TlpA family protein disulfide reductase [Burkholderiales bacterium]